jgi:hypothetical protein
MWTMPDPAKSLKLFCASLCEDGWRVEEGGVEEGGEWIRWCEWRVVGAASGEDGERSE